MVQQNLTSAGNEPAATIGVIAVVSGKDDDVSLVYKFVAGFSKRQSEGTAQKLRELADEIHERGEARRSFDRLPQMSDQNQNQ